MKKKLIFGSLGVCLAVGLLFNLVFAETEKNKKVDLLLSSIEASSQSESEVSYGPLEMVKCKGGGYHYVCACRNKIPCNYTYCE